MADVFANTGTFTIERLRADDTAYSAGATRALGRNPAPIAVARGPLVVGPAASPLGGEYWGIGVAVPAVPEVVWIVVNAEMHVGRITGTEVAAFALFCFGDPGDCNATRAPALVLCRNIEDFAVGGGGAFTEVDGGCPAQGKGLYFPLDPSLTKDGWKMFATVRVGGTPPGVNGMRIDLTNVVLLGYPVNLWGTGRLWETSALRGS